MSTLTRERIEQLANGNNICKVTREERIELARIALASLEAEPVAWDYEWASCITCEGPQDFKRVIEREAPPEWAIGDGQARDIIPLYRHPQTSPIVPKLCAAIEALLDMQVRMVKQTNVGASFFDGETISAMNYAPIQAKQALELAKPYK